MELSHDNILLLRRTKSMESELLPISITHPHPPLGHLPISQEIFIKSQQSFVISNIHPSLSLSFFFGHIIIILLYESPSLSFKYYLCM